MTDPHPTPPPELVEKWVAEIWHEGTAAKVAASDRHIATQAARWASDQQLEACAEWADTTGWEGAGDSLRAAMRPLSDKQKALKALAPRRGRAG